VAETAPNEHSRQPVTIVTGLPRSGTSLMMQMLAAGGLPVLTDDARAADADNPRGYHEFEPVKKTRQDRTWLGRAAGKAVKMVHLLVHDLPRDRSYQLILMRRNLTEVVRSQNLMLRRLGRRGADLTPTQLIEAYRRQLAELTDWLEEQADFTYVTVDFNDLLREPEPIIRRLNRFLGGRLNEGAMRRVIDPTLYRQRSDGRDDSSA